MKQLSLVLMMLIFVPSMVYARDIGGIQLPDSLDVAGKTLFLNGAGLRTKLFFKIYAGGLYLLKPSQESDKIIQADAPMLVRMHFIYDGVSGQKLQEAWNDGFAITAPDASESLRPAINDFVTLFSEEAKKGDVYDMFWWPGHGLRIIFNGQEQAVISGLDFKQALFGIWLGNDPVDDDLKEGMLGR